MEAWSSSSLTWLAAPPGVREQSRGALTGAPQELPTVADDAVLWETAAPEGFREYPWLAGGARVITGLRRHLVKEVGLSRKQVSFMGYWKQCRPGA